MSFIYWDDWVDTDDMEEMWMDPRISEEWISVGEAKGRKVYLSKDPDGQVYLTQNEMKVMNGHIGTPRYPKKIWKKCGGTRSLEGMGKIWESRSSVRFSLDANKSPYLSRVDVKVIRHE